MMDKDRQDFLLSLIKKRPDGGNSYLFPMVHLINSTYELDPPVTQEEWDGIIKIIGDKLNECE